MFWQFFSVALLYHIVFILESMNMTICILYITFKYVFNAHIYITHNTAVIYVNIPYVSNAIYIFTTYVVIIYIYISPYIYF